MPLEPKITGIQVETDIRRLDNSLHFRDPISWDKKHVTRLQHEIVLQVTSLLHIVQIEHVDLVIVGVNVTEDDYLRRSSGRLHATGRQDRLQSGRGLIHVKTSWMVYLSGDNIVGLVKVLQSHVSPLGLGDAYWQGE